MGQSELLIGGVLVAVAGLGGLAGRLSVPYPIVLVMGGALFGFVPGVPMVTLDPSVVLVVFLPVLVYGAAFFANLGDIRANLRGITLASVCLVLVTMVVVAVVAHWLVGIPWSAAFALGAIVSPTDPLAPALIMRRLDVPRRLVSAAEGEGLFNDATAFVVYRIAVGAVVAGTFSITHAAVSLVASLLDFIINSSLFVLVGLQLQTVVRGLSSFSAPMLIGWGLAICAVAVITRIVWFFTVPTWSVSWTDDRAGSRTGSARASVCCSAGAGCGCGLARGSPRSAAHHQGRIPIPGP